MENRCQTPLVKYFVSLFRYSCSVMQIRSLTLDAAHALFQNYLHLQLTADQYFKNTLYIYRLSYFKNVLALTSLKITRETIDFFINLIGMKYKS